MFILKFFSRPIEAGVIPTYRAMAVTSYEVSPPFCYTTPVNTETYATIVLHLLDGSVENWDLRGDDMLIIENAQGSTTDKIRNPNPTIQNTAGFQSGSALR